MIRVSIVAASPLARAGLKNLLTGTDLAIVESVASAGMLGGDRGLEAESDVIIADLSGVSFESSLASLANGAADTPIILVIDQAATTAMQPALRAGVRGQSSRGPQGDRTA